MMSNEKLRRADLVTSILLLLLSAAVIVGALQMPLAGSYGGRTVHWYTSPAFFPLVLASLLIVCSLGVLQRALREGGHRQFLHRAVLGGAALPRNRVAHRILAIWMLLLAYILGLAAHPFGKLSEVLERTAAVESPFTVFLVTPEGINYVLASFLFLSAFMLLFWRDGRFWMRCGIILFVSGSVSWGVGYVFTQHLYTLLPW